MKITKITENMAMKSQMSTGGGSKLPKDDRGTLVRELETQLEKIKNSGGGSKNIAKEWLENFDKGEDFAKDKKFSLRTHPGQGGPTDEALMALQKELNPSAFGKLKKMFGFKEGKIRTTESRLRSQLRRIIREAMTPDIPDTMGAIGGGKRQIGPTVPDDMISRIKSIDRGDFQDHLYDIVDAIESGDDDYSLDMLKKNIEDAEAMVKAGTNESTVTRITKRQLRKIIKEAIDIVNVETGEVIDFGEESLSGLPDAAVPDLVKRLGLDMSPGGQLSNADFEKLEDETLGKQNLRHNKKALAQSKSNAERLNIDNLLNRLGDWAHEYFQDYAADNPGTDLQDVALDLAKTAEYEFEADEWDELLWHFDDDENALNVYTAESMG